jgi:hypothetical protein
MKMLTIFLSGLLITSLLSSDESKPYLITTPQPSKETMAVSDPSKSWPITPQLCELLDVTGITCDRTLPAIVEATQNAWLRKAGSERWEIIEFYTQSQQKQIAELCDKMGFFGEALPQNQHYAYCCILGAALPTARARILYVKELWEQGVRFDHVILLTGDRNLDDRIDLVPELDLLPRNESAAIELLYSRLPLPQEMRELPVTLIDTPKKDLRRPSTCDTITEWMNQSPRPGNCLFISNQPWVKYQKAVVGCYLSKEFPFEVVGPKASSMFRKRAAVMLDNVARWLYAEYELSQRKNP